MEKKNKYFDVIQKQNLQKIRNVLWNSGITKVSDIAMNTGLSYPTVSKLLKELEKQGIVVQCEELITCGGRPGARYRIAPYYQQAVVMYFENGKIECSVYDYAMTEIFHDTYEADETIEVLDIVEILNRLLDIYVNITCFVLGIPGVTLDKEIVFLPAYPRLVGRGLEEKCEEMGIYYYVENDTNAIALALRKDMETYAYIACINNCIGVGIVYSGKVVQGTHGYAGELEYLCSDLADMTQTFSECILSLVCVLDMSLIYISADVRENISLSEIMGKLSGRLPKQRLPEIRVVEEPTKLYKEGLKKRFIEEWRKA